VVRSKYINRDTKIYICYWEGKLITPKCCYNATCERSFYAATVDKTKREDLEYLMHIVFGTGAGFVIKELPQFPTNPLICVKN
jgi:hypothetical protein